MQAQQVERNCPEAEFLQVASSTIAGSDIDRNRGSAAPAFGAGVSLAGHQQALFETSKGLLADQPLATDEPAECE